MEKKRTYQFTVKVDKKMFEKANMYRQFTGRSWPWIVEELFNHMGKQIEKKDKVGKK